MPSSNVSNDWRLIYSSAHGAKHILENKPNQDRIIFSPSPDSGATLPIILAVADGHGANIHFRSDRGAQMAVDSAIEVCKKLEDSSFNSLKDTKIKEWLCRDIYRKWLEYVQRDIESSPFSEEEKNLLQSKMTEPKTPSIVPDKKDVIAYGSTLLTTVIHETFILFIQLGDGDILVINKDGSIDKPIPDDTRFIGTETTSLCLPEAWYEFKVRLNEISNNADYPLMILVSTDGLSGSWRERPSPDHGINKFGMDIVTNICENPDGISAGLAVVEESLPDWLTNISKTGIGDDITAGLIINRSQIKKFRDATYDIKIKRKFPKIILTPNSMNQT